MITSGGGGGVQPIPAELRKVVQRLQEIVNGGCPEEEIYAVLQECNMDPNHAVDRLLSQSHDPFQEVKTKREMKKKKKQACRSSGAGLGGRSYNSTSRPPLHGRSPYTKQNGRGPNTIFDGALASAGHRMDSVVGVPAADNVRTAKTNKKGSNVALHAEASAGVSYDKNTSTTNYHFQISGVCSDDEVHNTLGYDELLNILLRLPATELVRCKIICKYWNSIISSREFISEHIKHLKSDPSSHYLLLWNNFACTLKEHIVPGPFSSVACFTSFHMAIVASVNGLICMAGDQQESPMSPEDIWILNPATCLSRKLPSPFEPRITRDTDTVLLAFWFDEISDGGVYKVAKLVSIRDGPSMLEVWVSSSPDTWSDVTTLDFHFYPCLRWVHECDVLIEGVGAYWIVADCNGDIFVLSLDLKTLALKETLVPSEQVPLPVDRNLLLHNFHNLILFGAILKGQYVLIQNSFRKDFIYYIWTPVMDGSEIGGWEYSFRVYLGHPVDSCLGWCINGKLVLRGGYNAIVLYEMDTGDEILLGQDMELKNTALNSAHDFVGSLAWIEGFECNDLNELGIGFSWPRDYPCASGRDYKKIL